MKNCILKQKINGEIDLLQKKVSELNEELVDPDFTKVNMDYLIGLPEDISYIEGKIEGLNRVLIILGE